MPAIDQHAGDSEDITYWHNMKIPEKIAIAVAPILVLGMAGVLIHALSAEGGSKGKLSPEETVLAYNRYMLSGETDSAGSLCTEQMSGHMGRFREVWSEIQRQDSVVVSAAERLLDSVEVHVSGTEKADDGRVLVRYSLTSAIPGSVEKLRVAELSEHKLHGEGGSVWRIEKIMDVEEN